MKGYARIKSFNDSSHNLSYVQSNEANDKKTISPQENKEMKTHDSEMENMDPYGQNRSNINAAPKFQRTCSVSSSMQPSQQMSTMKRTFSIRRSSSVSEGYHRIHDQHAALESSADGDDEDANNVGCPRKERKTKRMLKACKRILGL